MQIGMEKYETRNFRFISPTFGKNVFMNQYLAWKHIQKSFSKMFHDITANTALNNY